MMSYRLRRGNSRRVTLNYAGFQCFARFHLPIETAPSVL